MDPILTSNISLSFIEQVEPIHAYLVTSAQPSAAQLAQIKATGFSTIINLGLDDEGTLNAQDRYCLELGLNYLHLPLLWDNPAPETGVLILDLVAYLVQQHAVWLHCVNHCRVACLMALYRQYYLNWDVAAVASALHRVWEPDETWTGFMHAVGLQLQARHATREIEALQHTAHTEED